MENRKRKISIYTPCLNEEANVDFCYEEIKKIMNDKFPNYDYEHIFGDNCSTDQTLSKLKNIASKDKNVKVLSYSRNFGAFQSLFYGITSVSGDGAICIAADLQDPPEVLIEMVQKWEQGFDVVYGKKTEREEGFIMQTIRKFYYKLVSKFASIDIPENVGEFCFLDRKVIDALKQFEDYYPYLRGMIANCGFKSAVVNYKWGKRKYGKTTGSSYILIDNAINGIISFTNIPLRFCLFIGISISTISILYSLYSFFVALLLPKAAAPGISMIIVAIFFFFGVTLFFLGILGEYVSAIHSQVRKKPMVIVREKINF